VYKGVPGFPAIQKNNELVIKLKGGENNSEIMPNLFSFSR